MREILFRGKRVDTGKWAVGGFAYGSNRGESLICPKYDFTKEVIPETVGQYTGLTDKNGKKVFEGDIVNIEYFETVVENAIIEYVGTSFYGSTDYDSWELDGYCELEVIGNIHDNPKLMKGGE